MTNGEALSRTQGTSTCGCNNNTIFQRELFSRFLASTYAGGTLAWQRQSLGDVCQSRNMATLLNSLISVFKISFLPNFRAKYYDYIVKMCSGVACNCCVSLDIDYILSFKQQPKVLERLYRAEDRTWTAISASPSSRYRAPSMRLRKWNNFLSVCWLQTANVGECSNNRTEHH